MEYSNKGWLYGLIVMLSQTCNPDYKQPSPFYGDEQMIEIPEDALAPTPTIEIPPPPSEESIFKVVEDMPRFPGCEDITDKNERKKCAQEKMLKFTYGNMKFPEEAKKQGVEGKAILQFVVEKDGNLSNIRVLREPGAGCGAEAVRLVNSMPRWIPGRQRGKTVKVQYTMVMRFKLDN